MSTYDNWIRLKNYILTKNSHGKNELLQKMVEIEIESANSRVLFLEENLKEAVCLLREGKKKFAPTTTNSLVDSFLGRHDNL